MEHARDQLAGVDELSMPAPLFPATGGPTALYLCERALQLEAGLLDRRLAAAHPAGLEHDPLRAAPELVEDVGAVGGGDVVLEVDRLPVDAQAELRQLGRARADRLRGPKGGGRG